MTQANGTVCFNADYYPNGQEIDFNTACNTSYKFTGYERDSETGLDYAFARYYNSRLGRFMTGDPAPADLSDPQTLNRYAYVRNNPVNLTDPIGMDLCGDICSDPDPGPDPGPDPDPGPPGGGGGGGVPIQPGRPNPPKLHPPQRPEPHAIEIPNTLGSLMPSNPGCTYGSGSCGGGIYGATGTVIYYPNTNPLNFNVWSLNFWLFGNTKGKWWPSKASGSCSIYTGSNRGLLGNICGGFGEGPRMDSIRGCLQTFYNPNYSQKAGGYENHPGLHGTHYPWGDLNGSVGIAAHAYCVPEGSLNP
jgi:RHS repeat-associated protein